MSENLEKNGNKKFIIIPIIVLLVIAISGGVGYFVYQYIEGEKPIEQEWADTYYNYIIGSEEEEITENKIQDDSQIGFLEVKNVENPVMIVEHEKEEKTVTDIYYINDGEVKNLINLDSSNVELLYDINEKEYDWYTHSETETSDIYKKVSTQILEDSTEENNKEDELQEYTFAKGEEISVDTVEGNKISISKFDTVFVKTDVEIEKIEYSEVMSDKELKTAIKEGANEYKSEEEIITEEIKNEVINKENEITAKQEEMKKAEEEKAKKEAEEKAKAEEEARKKAEEEAAKGLKVGKYTLKYGKYTFSMDDYDGKLTGAITLQPNGQFYIKSNFDEATGDKGKGLDCAGTYTVELNVETGSPGAYSDGISFKPNSGEEFFFEVINSTGFSDQWHGYTYVGN